MIYLGNLEKTQNEGIFIVGYVHYMPFDEIHGMGMTKEKLEQQGILLNLDKLEDAPLVDGKTTELMWDDINQKYFYTYIERTFTDEEIKTQNQKIIASQLCDLEILLLSIKGANVLLSNDDKSVKKLIFDKWSMLYKKGFANLTHIDSLLENGYITSAEHEEIVKCVSGDSVWV